jgi:hypothetical protein
LNEMLIFPVHITTVQCIVVLVFIFWFRFR